jgi:hypothetical protein
MTTMQKILKMERLPEHHLPRQLMATWTPNLRKGGQPQLSLQNMMAKAIETIIPETGKKGCLEIWLP